MLIIDGDAAAYAIRFSRAAIDYCYAAIPVSLRLISLLFRHA